MVNENSCQDASNEYLMCEEITYGSGHGQVRNPKLGFQRHGLRGFGVSRHNLCHDCFIPSAKCIMSVMFMRGSLEHRSWSRLGHKGKAILPQTSNARALSHVFMSRYLRSIIWRYLFYHAITCLAKEIAIYKYMYHRPRSRSNSDKRPNLSSN